MKTCLVSHKEGEEKKFKVTLKKYELTFTADEKWQSEKWVNSIQFVYENIGEYIGHENVGPHAPAREERYLMSQVYEKKTGKTCYKDYEVLCEQYE